MSILSDLKIIEIEGLGPGPFCGMLLADLGAEVIVVAKPGAVDKESKPLLMRRGKQVIEMDLKDPNQKKKLLTLLENADGLIEGMRPGVMERLGLGPDICLERNPKLAYGRMTGWGQTGPLAKVAGHDINYIGLSGALWYSGRLGDPPFAPPTLVGDIGGGALYLAVGLLSAILNARRTGKGDIIDAAIVDGSAHMMNLLHSFRPTGQFTDQRGKSLLDGPHWYDSYECSDGKFITLGPLEPKFYKLLLDKLGLSDEAVFFDQFDEEQWVQQKIRLAEIIRIKTRKEWCEQLEGTDVCFSPVLTPSEAADHPHMKARKVYSTYNGHLAAEPAPRFTFHPSKANNKSK